MDSETKHWGEHTMMRGADEMLWHMRDQRAAESLWHKWRRKMGWNWKHEAEKQIRLARGAIDVLEQHNMLLTKERDELRARLEAANSPLRSSSTAE